MNDRFNTIAGWVLFAGIVALGGSILSGELFKTHELEHGGYPIEGVEAEGGGNAEAEKPIEFYLASADATKGEQVFKKCTACHNADKGGANALGPNLYGVLGEPQRVPRCAAARCARFGEHAGASRWRVVPCARPRAHEYAA